MKDSRFNPIIVSLGQFPYAAFIQRKKELLATGLKIYDFSIGDPHDETPDVIRQHLSTHIPEQSQYPDVLGTHSLRVAISAYLKRRLSITVDPETQLLVHSGSKEAIFHFPQLFSNNPESRSYVIYGTPGYFVYERGARIAGLNPYPIHLTAEKQYLLDLNEVPEKVLEQTALVWFNYPHNPSGAHCTLDYLKKQYEIASRYDIILCSDETYVDLYFDTPSPSILEVSTKGVLAFHSCSKRSGMTGYRSGFIAGDASLIEPYASFRNTVGTAASQIIQIASEKAWSEDRHATERRMLFKDKRDLFVSFLKDRGFEFQIPDATFYLWVKAPEDGSAYEYCKRLLEKGLVFSPGDFYGEVNSDYFRIALSPLLTECKQALSHWQSIGI